MPLTRSLELIFAGALLVIVLGGLRLVNGDFPLQSNLLALLPEDEGTEASRLASEQLTDSLANDFVFFIKGSEADQVIAATRSAAELIENSPSFQRISPDDAFQAHISFLKMLKQHRFYLLSQEQVQQLESGAGTTLLDKAMQSAYDLSAGGSIATLQEDPLGLFNRYLLGLPDNALAAELQYGVVLLHNAGMTYGVLHGRATTGAFNLDVQTAAAVLESDLIAVLENQNTGLELLRAGAIFHASRAANIAKSEVSLIGLGSGLGIFLLFIATFRSVWPLVLSLASVAFGCLFALVFCWNLYGSLHLLTLVFGASLIGVAVDYSLHYLTREHGSEIGLPGLGLAVLTSIVGYGSLFEARLPGMREMAMFSITGLIASGLFVLVIFPRARHRAGAVRAGLLPVIARLPTSLWHRKSIRIAWIALLLALLALLLSQVQLTNDVRVFHTPDTTLLEEQQEIDSLVPGHAPNQFFLIQDNTAESLLQSAEAFRSQLDSLVQRSAIDDYLLISDTLPSLQRQQKNNQLLNSTVYRAGGEADTLFSRLGFSAQVGESFREDIEKAVPLTQATWSASAPEDLAVTWLGQHDGAFYSIVLLDNVRDIPALQRSAANDDAVEFVDTVASISHSLEARTVAACKLLVLAYAAIGAVLLLRYRKVSALRLLLVPLCASIATVAVLTMFGMALTLFHIFALYLILGLGMDYGIFLRESGSDSQSCLLAILLSVLTSSLSFGLLALSSTPMIAAFGLTVMLGGVCNWLLVPLAVQK